MGVLNNPSIWLTVVAGVSIVGAHAPAQAGNIGGATTGSTASAGPENAHPQSRDDTDVTTTIDITFLTGSAIITHAAMAFPGFDFVFAGAASGPGSHFTPIDPSDFYIQEYIPWVVDSPDLVTPSGDTYNRGVVDQDAGGANILIEYTPKATDPTHVSFLQAYSLATNGGAATGGKMDNGGTGGPYYQEHNAAGIGNMNQHTVPLVASESLPAWMADAPYTCESGFFGITDKHCPATTPQNDETITSEVDIFNTFIESDMSYMGTSYDVLFGGFQWGYTYTATDAYEPPTGVPEPSTWAMLALGFAGLGGLRYRSLRRPNCSLSSAARFSAFARL